MKILNIQALKSYGMKENFKIIKQIILLLLFVSCTKQEIGENKYQFDKYKVVYDKYSLDTSILYRRGIWWYNDSVYTDAMRLNLDTTKDNWFINCATLDTLEHWYVLKNGKKIQPSKYPLN